jgi:hypothetical protein
MGRPHTRRETTKQCESTRATAPNIRRTIGGNLGETFAHSARKFTYDQNDISELSYVLRERDQNAAGGP